MASWAVCWRVMPLRFGCPEFESFPLLSYLNKRKRKKITNNNEGDSIRILVPQIQYLVHPRMIIIPALTHPHTF